MLSCKDISELSSEFLDGQLTTRQRLAFRLHVMLCKACGNYMTQLHTTRAAVTNIVGPEIPPHLLARLQKARKEHAAPEATANDESGA
jgi:hypothetical protein